MGDMGCAVEGCNRDVETRLGWCRKHSERIMGASKRSGDLSEMRQHLTDEEMAAYAELISGLMETDADSVRAIGKPIHVSPEEWNKGAAEDWQADED